MITDGVLANGHVRHSKHLAPNLRTNWDCVRKIGFGDEVAKGMGEQYMHQGYAVDEVYHVQRVFDCVCVCVEVSDLQRFGLAGFGWIQVMMLANDRAIFSKLFLIERKKQQKRGNIKKTLIAGHQKTV